MSEFVIRGVAVLRCLTGYDFNLRNGDYTLCGFSGRNSFCEDLSQRELYSRKARWRTDEGDPELYVGQISTGEVLRGIPWNRTRPSEGHGIKYHFGRHNNDSDILA